MALSGVADGNMMLEEDTCAYNGLDARVSKTDSSGTYGFKRNGAGVTDPLLSDGAATYTPGISERRGGNSKFLHSGMKNADAQSGSSANVDSSRTYDAFGNLTGSAGTWSGPFGYAGGFGYQEDPDHGLRLLGHRYYDSSTGRFISKDPIGDGRNWTAYCAANPIKRIDPAGLQLQWAGTALQEAQRTPSQPQPLTPVKGPPAKRPSPPSGGTLWPILRLASKTSFLADLLMTPTDGDPAKECSPAAVRSPSVIACAISITMRESN